MTHDDLWWRHAVIYQIYPRSFSDANGDGVGDIQGVIERIDSLHRLGVDAIWLSPFFPSPQRDAGYDVTDYRDIDPLFGSLDDFDALTEAAHARGIRIIVDIVPNHTSSEHRWFLEALSSQPGSPARNRYIFRDGTGENGELPPNNWQSLFGGSAWERVIEPNGAPGQWYLHLFDPGQPDLNWRNEEVRAEFDDVLRFWLRRGTDGFRIDVAHGLIKDPSLPSWRTDGNINLPNEKGDPSPAWAQPEVHDIFRRWHKVLAEFGPDRMMCSEAWVSPLSELAKWVRPDEMQQTFNFGYLQAEWSAAAQRHVIDSSLTEFGKVGATATWVLSNHDVIRVRSRLSLPYPKDGHYELVPGMVFDDALGLRRARAAAMIMLSLPGTAYVYQGEELGLPEVTDIPADRRQDPTFSRTHGTRLGRDGSRVPLPWTPAGPTFGFNTSGKSWLPQPGGFGALSRATEQSDPASVLALYTTAIGLRREHSIGSAALSWLPSNSDEVVAYRVGDVDVVVNFGDAPIDLPENASILLTSTPLEGHRIAKDQAVWYEA